MKKFSILSILLLTLFAVGCITEKNNPINPDTNKITLPPDYNQTIIITDSKGKVYDTGIIDRVLPDGSKISDKIQECIQNARNHGDFVSCMAHLTNYLRKNGFITEKEKGILMNIAARADIP